MSRYQADPNNPKKQIPKQTNSQNSAGIAVFATDVIITQLIILLLVR